ncbi:MAG: hypothetical protein Q8922_10740 [Bacteroidota bacterium]|nr:hypothetical protein [Bacteroidota bacterium]MDP4232676.1 hypothetical protein [Bacteroidota bacterium]MDP4243191.1 hypothetical protein [Bacteroidota bacterium]MDP4288403.1 hypothetical protein [Bacteroidota bacterium]
MKLRILAAGVLLAFLSLNSTAFAQSASASGMFSVQGRLTNLSGAAIADGSHRITSSLYVKGNATAIYTETDTVNTLDGVFTVLLGAKGTLTLDATTKYEVGIALDGAAELAPHIALASAPRAITALVADTTQVANSLSASAISGLAATLGSNVVTSVNGQRGAVTILGGGNLNVNSSSDTIQLSFAGSGGGLILPYVDTAASAIGSLFSIDNTSTGTAATFTNTGTGNGLRVQAKSGSAISAQSNGTAATIDVANTGGLAINALSTTASAFSATTNAGEIAALMLRNSGSGSGRVLLASNSNGATILDATNIGTTIAASDTSRASFAVLKLQNRAANGNNLLVGMDSLGNGVFTLSSTGAANLKSSAATALNVNAASGIAVNATGYNPNGPALQIMNTALPSTPGAIILAARDSGGATVMKVAANGTTSLSSSSSMALNVAAKNAAGAAAQMQNTSSASASALIAKDSTGNTILNAAGNGSTLASYSGAAHVVLNVTPPGVTITATGTTGGTALYDSTSSGNTAARFAGGIQIAGPVGTGTILTGNGSATISNPYVKANSIIFLTVASNAASIVPIHVASVTNGSFAVALIGVGSLANDLSFNYLIINQ